MHNEPTDRQLINRRTSNQNSRELKFSSKYDSNLQNKINFAHFRIFIFYKKENFKFKSSEDKTFNMARTQITFSSKCQSNLHLSLNVNHGSYLCPSQTIDEGIERQAKEHFRKVDKQNQSKYQSSILYVSTLGYK